MIQYCMSLLSSDKTLKHPILGEITCSGFCTKHQECKQFSELNQIKRDNCYELKAICD